MKHDRKNSLSPSHSTLEWARETANRYLMGLTSIDEEKALAEFLKTPQGANEEFDALRAIFVYLEMGRIVHHKHLSTAHHPRSNKDNRETQRRYPLSLRINRIAATILIIILGGWMCWEFSPDIKISSPESTNISIAYVGGKPITDPNIVHRMMKESLQSVCNAEEVDIVKEQLNEMFPPLTEEER